MHVNTDITIVQPFQKLPMKTTQLSNSSVRLTVIDHGETFQSLPHLWHLFHAAVRLDLHERVSGFRV